MPIEFTCDGCDRGLRVPDGTSGKRFQCPACGQAQEIPYVVHVDDAHAGHSPQQQASYATLSIPCPKCHHHLVCPAELLGTRGQCRQCAHIFTIDPNPVLGSNTVEAGWIFHCPECQQLFEGREDMCGRKGKCHVCKAVFEIELELAPAPLVQDAGSPRLPERDARMTSTPNSAADRPASGRAPQVTRKINRPADVYGDLKVPVTRSAAPRPQAAVASGPLRFECVQCQGEMEVPASASGLSTACPYCHAVQTIPAPQAGPSSRSLPVKALTNQRRSALLPNAISGLSDATAGGPFSSEPFDPLAALDLAPQLNPYAVSTNPWVGPSGRRSIGRGGLTVGNVLRLAFESLFPACLVFFLYCAIMAGLMLLGGGMLAILLNILVALQIPREVILVAYFVALVFLLLASVIAGAWVTACMHHTALRAVRKERAVFSESFSSGGAYRTALLIGGISMVFSLLANLPTILNLIYPGTLQGLGALILVWLGFLVLSMIASLTATSFGCFAAIDGECSGEALATSGSMLLANFPVMVGVKILAWLMTLILIIPSLGLAAMLPIFTNAALYHLARRSR